MEQITKIFNKIEIQSNILYIISTPIGNLGDISIRALKVLSLLDIILCEDTRVTKKLLNSFNIKSKKLIVYNDQSTEKQRKLIIDKIKYSNLKCGLVSDAGTPLISDPGYKLVQACMKEMIDITHIPGASSLITSLILSGLPSHNFLFGGFLEKSIMKRKKQLENILNLNFTSVWFESSKRLSETLKLILDFKVNAEISVLRELTKLNEEIIRGTASFVYNQINQKLRIRGEVVIIISTRKKIPYSSELIKSLIKENIDKYSTKELSLFISNKTGLPKKFIYNKIIEYKS